MKIVRVKIKQCRSSEAEITSEFPARSCMNQRGVHLRGSRQAYEKQQGLSVTLKKSIQSTVPHREGFQNRQIDQICTPKTRVSGRLLSTILLLSVMYNLRIYTTMKYTSINKRLQNYREVTAACLIFGDYIFGSAI